jgi:two-component system, NtrC family, nitrogen regulation sensor histidine kinase NtrY
VALSLVSLIPVVLMLFLGTTTLREVVMSTGSAGAWDEVARSGRDLFDQIQARDSVPPALAAAIERHEAALNESVRFSRLYTFVGERILVLLPALALMLLALVGGLALVAANWFARDFAKPVEELVGLTRSLASGDAIPPPDARETRHEIREFTQLREAVHATSEELREARRREVEQARTRSWAEMARMIAHELKNPLTPMAMAAERVAHAREPSVAEAGEVLRDEIGRLEEMARAFAQFGRPPEGPMSSIDVNELLSGLVVQMVAQGMSVALDAPGEHLFVRGHLVSLDRVVRNLVSNAQDAVDSRAAGAPPAGEDSTDGATAGPPVRVALDRDVDRVRIRVTDRGTGIPDAMLERIWEPEFTMKRRGSGLGLPMVRQVVEAHGGAVRARNRAEGGAEFTLWLPVDPQAPSVEPDAHAGEREGEGGRKRGAPQANEVRAR